VSSAASCGAWASASRAPPRLQTHPIPLCALPSAAEPKWNSFVDGCGRATASGCGACISPRFYFATVTAKGSNMSALISILVTFLVVILVLYLVNMLPIDGRAKHIVRIVVIIIGILSLLKYLGVWI
jgi:hypothetical protein